MRKFQKNIRYTFRGIHGLLLELKSILFTDLFEPKKKLTLRVFKWHIKANRPMFKKVAFATVWFLATPLLIGVTSLLFYNKSKPSETSFTATPLVVNEFPSRDLYGQVLGVEITDNRPYIVEGFLKGTPLAPYAQEMVTVADKYNLDYRLIPAIAMKETGGGNAAPSGSFNAWGFGNGRTEFTSWESAIESVGKTLKTKYADKGLITPEQIMPIYAPPQVYTGGKWAKDINHFFSKMESF